MMAIILEGVTKTYGPRIAVDRLSFAVPRGSVFGFLGPNGSGKTTTLRMMLDLLRADGGVIEVEGTSDPDRRRAAMGYLPEERGLYRRARVGEMLVHLGRLRGESRRGAEEHARTWLQRLDLEARWDAPIGTLSKGTAQKVQFVAATMGSPSVLLLDEPFSGLDPLNLEAMRQAILDLRAEGKTILLSTHDMPSAESMCDGLVLVSGGRRLAYGSAADLKQEAARRTGAECDNLHEAFLALAAPETPRA